jgi:Protein of unknown function (DUF3141)
VYLINPHIGHLGIFVSAEVARFEHRAILESLADVEALSPGLYEMKISNPTGDPDCRRPQYKVSFEERRVEDLIFDFPRKEFERVRQVSEINEAFYRIFVSPWVQAATTPWTATMLKWLHPMRTSRYLLSEKFSPWMHIVAAFAKEIRKNRVDFPASSPFREAEREFSKQIANAIETARQARDNLEEESFRRIYG